MAWRAIIEPPGLTDAVVEALTTALFRIDLDYLLRHPEAPPLYESGVRYRMEPRGSERWASVPSALERNWGDCEDLGCWRAGEIVTGAVRSGRFNLGAWLAAEAKLQRLLPARPAYRSREIVGGGHVYHILTRVGESRLEDPSRRLGMKGAD